MTNAYMPIFIDHFYLYIWNTHNYYNNYKYYNNYYYYNNYNYIYIIIIIIAYRGHIHMQHIMAPLLKGPKGFR